MGINPITLATEKIAPDRTLLLQLLLFVVKLNEAGLWTKWTVNLKHPEVIEQQAHILYSQA